ncbi:MAG TPA: capsular polysaccharide synthesis protein [Mycobacteriales bacterium]|nr:capsular polysaccharide synthesis protein [Mycobacteriales bacterium]
MTAPEPAADITALAARGRRLARAGEHARAVRVFRRLAEADPDNAEWWWRLTQLHHRLGREPAARRAAVRALAVDGGATSVDRALLRTTPAELRARRRTAQFVAEHLDDIRRRAAAGVSAAPRRSAPRVFTFWAQGFAEAPPVVQRCRQEARRWHTDEQLVALTDADIAAVVSLPPVVVERTSADKTRFSDFLRLQLLLDHGGVWMDATCLTRSNLVEAFPALTGSGFFAFERRTNRLSNWMLAASPGHPVIAMLRAAHLVFWEQHERVWHYYLFHHLFEALVLLDAGFRQQWQRSPRLSAGPPHALQEHLDAPYTEPQLRELLNGSFVHKLTYKYDAGEVGPQTLLGHLVDHGLPPDLDEIAVDRWVKPPGRWRRLARRGLRSA